MDGKVLEILKETPPLMKNVNLKKKKKKNSKINQKHFLLIPPPSWKQEFVFLQEAIINLS